MANLNIERFFKSFPTLAHRRNRFPWEKEVNFDMSMGQITPITLIRTVPGQTYNLDMAMVLKVAPLQVPPQDNAVLKIFAFHNPDRNEWTNYKYWFGEKQNPENPNMEPTYLFPKVTLPEEGFPYNSFYDNIGCVPEKGGYKIDATIPRSDREIYNYYFRNQTLENRLKVNKGDEDDNPNQNMNLRYICKPRDYFTQALPTQSGATSVEIPLGSEAPVFGSGYAPLYVADPITELLADNKALLLQGQPNYMNYSGIKRGDVGGLNSVKVGTKITDGMLDTPFTESNFKTAMGFPTKEILKNSSAPERYTGLYADLSTAAGAPLEGLYQAIAYNTYQYMTSRGGNRYFEQISNIYGTVNPDGVLQQPEFLGSLSCPIEFDTVTQTSSTSGEATPLGNRSANGYAEVYGSIVNKSFGEFGWIFIYAVVTHYPKYQQGVSKLMQTTDPLELFNPLFNLIGDEPIYRSEIYVQSDSVESENGTPVNDEVFGYGKRNARLLYPINEVHGRQRSSYPQSLDTNHFGEYFESMPYLNKEFDKINDNSFKRALMVTDETQFVGNCVITGTQDIEIPLEAIPQPIPLATMGVNV